MEALRVTCHFCGHKNELYLEGVTESERVTCSHCHNDIGKVGELQKPAGDQVKSTGQSGKAYWRAQNGYR